MAEQSKAERELRRKIITFLGEVYQPHQNFEDLPQGVQNDLLWEGSEIEIFVKEALPELAKKAGYVLLANLTEEQRYAIWKSVELSGR